MNVLLFNPAPRSGFQAHERVELPLSLLCPAAPLDRKGYTVTIIDQFADPEWERKFEAALDARPLCVGVTCMTGPQILYAIEVSRRVKAKNPATPVIWGGVHASLMPAQTLANPYIDAVVVGEGEATFAELVDALRDGSPLSGIAGLQYKEGGAVRTTPPRDFVELDAEPPMPYHLIDVDRYRRRLFGVDHLTFNSSRGCIFRCTFCWDPVMHQRTWRAMRPPSG